MAESATFTKSLAAIAGHLCWTCSSPVKDGSARRVLMPSNPATCEIEPLLMCSACRRVRYCCSACQVADWKDHKRLCKVFQILNKHVADEPAAHPREFRGEALSESFWVTLQRARIMLFRQQYGPRALAYDRPLLYAPKCFYCLRSPFHAGVELAPCSGCRVVLACPAHWPLLTAHTAAQCAVWEEMAYLEVAREDYLAKTREPAVLIAHEKVNGHYPGLPASGGWDAYFRWRESQLLSVEGDGVEHMLANPDIPRLLRAASTESASMVLTILAALGHIYSLEEMNRLPSLTIHLVGGDGSEPMTSRVYEELLHVLPSVKRVDVVLISPSADMAGHSAPVNLDCCPRCRAAGRRRTLQMVPTTYDQSSRASFTKPDLVAAFNSGMSEEDPAEWRPVVRKMAALDVPVLLTCYNEDEARMDRAFAEALGAEVIRREERNAWSSLVAVPEPEKPGEVFYKNGWWFMIRGKKR